MGCNREEFLLDRKFSLKNDKEDALAEKRVSDETNHLLKVLH